ncbi:MAG TPA: ornithine cyclodeaminase family protein [Candidatus Cybelea sp.]|jgi:thiomorpholine-carboxylate dehydrogenase|nr:ornithine cyclodeaminase family protein [Candidatus Cybelea sp.]
MIYLDEEAVRKLLQWDALIAAMEAALTEFSRGTVLHPVRNVLTIDERRRYAGIMPAVLGDVMGLKFVSFYPVNADSELPTHNATILLYRTKTGQPLAVMDGRLITEMRTAAVSAAVTKYLAPPQSRVLALLGSGVQAHSHLRALSHVCTFSEVRVWSRNAAHAARFAHEHGVTAVESPAAAVRGADVVVTATAAHEPILEGAWLKPGAHVNAVGSSRPDWRELDDAAMANTVVVDSREAAAKEAGDVIIANARIYAEAGEIFAGAKEPMPAATTIFKSVGLAVEDIAAAKLVFESAAARACEES